ncbi:hypothetical protein [Streptomyces omiyaensis]|uniref:hypothetical protein n=1 Tax=Streptomyces omiyaensis TaxID=68247 RepID=UPI0036FB0F58
MPAAPAPRPGGGSSAGKVAVRVLVTAAVVLSLGLLAWVAMLRLAIMRRTVRDWVLFWAQLALTVGCFVLLQEEDQDSWQINVGAAVVLAMAAAVVWHYLATDIKHHRAAAVPGARPPHGAPAYGYPPVDPATAVTLPGPNPNPYTQQPQPQPPNPYATTPPASAPTPPPSPRIDQVRAELDELSDLLRKEGEK